jgi:two-component system, cell cycle sensor histidine kinase and response regulator CckA
MTERKTVLLVEDTPSVLLVEGSTLTNEGYEVIAVPSGEEAIEIVKSGCPIDLILMDINLGAGMDGTEAAQEILKDHDIPVVFLSSHTEKEIVERTERITSYGYVIKNSGITVLDASIKMAFKLHEAHRELKKKEEILRESEQRFRSLFERHHAVMLLIEPESGAIVDANPAASRFYGYTRDELSAMNIADINQLPPEEIALVRKIATKQEQNRFVFAHRLASGEIRTVEVHTAPVPVEKQLLLFSIIHDITERKQTEEALVKSEERYRDLVDSLPQTVVEFDEKGNITFANQSGFEVFGYTQEEFEKGLNVTHMVVPEDRGRAAKNIKRTVHRRRAAGNEYVMVRKDGSTFPGIVYTSVITGKNVPVGFRAIIVDITERKRAEEAIRESETTLRSLIDATTETLLLIDTEGKILVANETVAQRLGRSVKGLVGRSVHELFPPDIAAPRKEEYEKVIRTGRSVHFQDKRAERVYDNHGYPVFDDEGRVTKVAIFANDVTERMRMEETLREREERLSLTLEATSDGLWDWDIPTGRAVFSPSYYTMLDYEPYEFSQDYDAWRGLVHPDDIDRAERQIKEHIERGEGYALEIRMRTKSGEWLWILTRGKAVQYDAAGRPVRMVGTHTDITERKNLEAQLLQAQKMEAIGTLAGGIAHDFNNILMALMGYASLIEMRTPKDHPVRTYVEQILSCTGKAANLTQSLLAFSRKQMMELKPRSLGAILKGLEKLLSRIVPEDIELTVSLGSDAIVMADVAQIDQVLINLVSNARDAMPKGGVCRIETGTVELDKEFIQAHGFGEPGRYAVISVTDTGSGIDEATQKKIFEPFFTTKEVDKGTGLGLSIAYGIVTQHNGCIDVQSEPGKGTTFRIYLPAVEAKVFDQEPSASDVPGGTETIMFAEDNPDLRRIVGDALGAAGYTVIEAIDGEEALEKFRANQSTIALVILDVVMPRKNGKETYESIRKIRPGIRTLFVSGYTADVVFDKGIEETMVDYISKPLLPAELLRKVREILDR